MLDYYVNIMKQHSAVMTIPSAIFKLMGLDYGDKLHVSYDVKQNAMIITKVESND